MTVWEFVNINEFDGDELDKLWPLCGKRWSFSTKNFVKHKKMPHYWINQRWDTFLFYTVELCIGLCLWGTESDMPTGDLQKTGAV